MKDYIKLAEKLREDKEYYRVGRTDMQSYTGNGIPCHYAYGGQHESVCFLGEDCLKDAVEFAIKMNAMWEKYSDE